MPNDNIILTDEQISQDLGPSYVNQREDLKQQAAGNALLQRVQERRMAKQQAGAGKAVEDVSQEETTESVEQPKEGEERGVMADIGRGIVEAPLQIVGGVADAAKETFESINDLGEWLNENVADLGQITAEGFEPGAPERSAIGEAIPTTAESESVTGGMVRDVSQFVAGFVGAGKVLKGMKVLQGATKGVQLSRAAVAGAMSDFAVFDPHEERLSNLIEQYPGLQNPVTEYLAASPEDGKAEGRFKNAIEGLGLGLAVEGFAKGVKTLRAARMAKKQAQSELGVAAKQLSPEELKAVEKEDLFNQMGGDPEAEAVTFDMGTKKRPASVKVNFSRINSQDDVKDVIGKMVKSGEKDIQKARRGVMTFEETKLNAEQLDAWDILSGRRKGEPLNAEETLAVRQLWVKSGERLADTATLAAKEPSEGNLFAFRRQLELHHMVQQEAIAVRTETARALSQWRIPAEGVGDVERFRAVQAAVDSGGGAEVAQQLAERVAIAAKSGDVALMDSLTAGRWAKTKDAVAQVWINGLLSSPQTHMVNFMSNTAVIGQQMYERKIANLLRGFYGGEGVVDGEVVSQAVGMIQGVKEALKVTKKGREVIGTATRMVASGDMGGARAAFAGQGEEFGGVLRSVATGETGFGIGKVELGRTGALSAETLGTSQDTMLGRGLDFVDFVTQAPGRALGASDEFFKSIGYRMELNAQATRKATQKVNAGIIPESQFKDSVGEILANPDESLRLAAADAASYQTFTQRLEGPVSKTMEKFQRIPVVGKFLMPFRNTPANIMKYTFERTPLAPMMKQFREDIGAGGARADLALARVSSGSMIMLAMADISMSGDLTGKGPEDFRERKTLQREGWQPYSMKIGDRYYSYRRMDPLGSTMGLAADMVDILSDVESSQGDRGVDRMVLAGIMAVGNNITNKTYMSGLSDFMEAMSNPDRRALSWAQRAVGSVIPASVGVVTRIEDPYMRAATDIMDGIRRRTPGLSKDLPFRRDLWGRKISYKSGIGDWYDVLSPIYSKAENKNPIDTELNRLEKYVSMPSKRTNFDGVSIDLTGFPKAYERYVQLAGNELEMIQHDDMGCMDFLSDVVSGKSVHSQIYEIYSDGPEGGKAEYIQNVINKYRAVARDQVLEEFPDLAANVEKKKLEQPSKIAGF